MSTRSMPRSVMRTSVLGDHGTYDLDADDNKTTKSGRSAKKGRKKTRGGSLGPQSPLVLRERRKPAVRRASLGHLDQPPNMRRNTVDSNNKIRRARRSKDGDDTSDDGSRKSRKSRKSLGSRKSVRSKSKRAVLGSLAGDDDNRSQRSLSRRERITESKANAMVVANADIQMQQRVETLQSKIVGLKQEQLDAQTEAMKLNKEKRELKLELQRSQTVVRELRSNLRDKDLSVKEETGKTEALEKAVESQLDKVEDLEEELKRANDEIFTLEDKLQQMEVSMAELEGSNPDLNHNNGTHEKESDFEAKRRERQERRLEQKEKELEQRERQLQRLQDVTASRNSFGGGSSSSGTNKQLEQDNRMLLKALNREKQNSSAKIKVKDDEIHRLNEKIARFLEQQGGDYNAETVRENELLAQQLDEEKQSHADTVQIKDEKIAKLEVELRQFKLTGSRHNPRDAETYKNEALDLRRQLEAAQQRNQLLEDEIDNWKNKNIGLEDELTELKARINKYRAQAASDSINNNNNNSSGNSRLNSSDHHLHDDNSDDGESSSKRGIGNLWGRVATAVKNRDMISGSNHNDDVVNRSTFH
eukprot:CAMPEP_0113627486 /NCGR_PEP_ID=MMETSP0017_2-20120614/14236_1 /TAXON_ID=2856 /ORGANISM="Cylindrotheca closterium" /LENGTH=587 /DNA_ID=CAMNT_0000537745 /DNA_START=27 /DNA_END=1790 /DNA_ORIENTATION=+ /assembly_acc=CAM_ASM_000147